MGGRGDVSTAMAMAFAYLCLFLPYFPWGGKILLPLWAHVAPGAHFLGLTNLHSHLLRRALDLMTKL